MRQWYTELAISSPALILLRGRILTPDLGQILATAWSDGSVRLISADSGKVIKIIKVCTTENTPITCLSWSASCVNREKILEHQREDLHLPQGSTRGSFRSSNIQSFDSLLQTLFNLEAESSLLKLGTLPAGHGDQDMFSTRTAVDALFHHGGAHDQDQVDILIVASAEGGIHISVWDGFEMGTFSLPKRRLGSPRDLVIGVSGNPMSTCYSLLTACKSRGVCLVPIELRMLATSGDHLRLIASRCTQLQNLVMYLEQTKDLILIEWRASQDLPRRFVRSIDEILQEKRGCTLAHECYELAATGHCSTPMRDWLVNELAERGHKRWDKAINSGFDGARKLVHENMIPALDRMAIVLSRLNGIACHPAINEMIGLSKACIAACLHKIDALRSTCHQILIRLGLELLQFGAFSHWLRHEITIQAGTAEKGADKDPNIDYRKVLDYIAGPLTYSTTAELMEMSPRQPSTDAQNDRRDALDQPIPPQSRLNENADNNSNGEPLCLSALVAQAQLKLNDLFASVAYRQKRNVSFGTPILLHEQDLSATTHAQIIMQTLTEHTGGQLSSVYVLLPLGAFSKRSPLALRKGSGRIRVLGASGGTNTLRLVRLELSSPHGDFEATTRPSREPELKYKASSSHTCGVATGKNEQEQQDDQSRAEVTAASVADINIMNDQSAIPLCARFLSPTELVILISQPGQISLLILPFNPILCGSSSCSLNYAECSIDRSDSECFKLLVGKQENDRKLVLSDALMARLARAVFPDDEGFTPDTMEVREGSRIVTLLSKDRLVYRTVELREEL